MTAQAGPCHCLLVQVAVVIWGEQSVCLLETLQVELEAALLSLLGWVATVVAAVCPYLLVRGSQPPEKVGPCRLRRVTTRTAVVKMQDLCRLRVAP